MKCWKCGEEIPVGSSICPYCSIQQNRMTPATAVGSAMRTLYDRYGAEEILSNSAYLVNGLGDLTEDSKKLRNQLKMALDAGLGRLYLEQLSTGAPDGAFDARVNVLLTEDAGLNEKTASELAGYFDEMIGWKAPTTASSPLTEEKPTEIRQEQATEKAAPAEVDRTGRYIAPEKPAINGTDPIIDKSMEQSVSEQSKKKQYWPFLLIAAIQLICLFISLSISGPDKKSEAILAFCLWGLLAVPGPALIFPALKGNRKCGVAGVIIQSVVTFLAGVLLFELAFVKYSMFPGGSDTILAIVFPILIAPALEIAAIKISGIFKRTEKPREEAR